MSGALSASRQSDAVVPPPVQLLLEIVCVDEGRDGAVLVSVKNLATQHAGRPR